MIILCPVVSDPDGGSGPKCIMSYDTTGHALYNSDHTAGVGVLDQGMNQTDIDNDTDCTDVSNMLSNDPALTSEQQTWMQDIESHNGIVFNGNGTYTKV